MNIKETFWKILAVVASIPPIRDSIINHSKKTPYFDIVTSDGTVYMKRWWLFNPYDNETRKSKFSWIPFNIRIHHILLPDEDRHLHSHPWDARTIILDGEYVEEKHGYSSLRQTGDTSLIRHEDYHRISYVHSKGVWTLFITYKYKGTWFFDVDGKKVQWKEYLKSKGM